MNLLPRLHLVTDDAVLADAGFPDVAEAVLDSCGRRAALHVRGHRTTGARLYALGERLRAAALRTGAWLLVNDRVDIALALRANGVQLGSRSLQVDDARALLGAGACIGCSVHGVADALQADADGADFVMLGTIYPSASHPRRMAAGAALVGETASRTNLPVIAIGGITAGRIVDVARAGAHGAAVLGGIWNVADPQQAAGDYVNAVRTAWPQDGGTA
ncbi:MAG: thiamine phosphate synthase [Longimicrobiales bacterium]